MEFLCYAILTQKQHINPRRFSGKAIATIRTSMAMKEFKAGEEIALEGGVIENFTIFTAGRADEIVNGDMINRSYFCGDFAGEISFVQENATYLFTITAVTNVHVITIPVNVIKPLLDSNPETGKFLENIKAYAALQSDGTWSALGQNLVMKEFTNLQRKDFLNFLEPPER